MSNTSAKLMSPEGELFRDNETIVADARLTSENTSKPQKNKKSDKRLHTVIIVENMTMPVDRRVWQEATALVSAGWKVSVICPQAGKYTKSFEHLEGVDVYRHPMPLEARRMIGYLIEYPNALFWEFILLFKIGLKNIDVVQICNPPDFLFLPAWVAKKFGGAKVIFDHHDLVPELYIDKTGKANGMLYKIACWAELMTFKLADRVISTNTAFRTLAIARGGKSEDEVDIVYSAPDLTRQRILSPNPDLKNGASQLLFWVGIISSQDGVDLLLEAIRILQDDLEEDDFHLLIAGEGPEKPHMMEMARNIGVAHRVTFAGFMSGDVLAEAFSTADIGVGSDPKNSFNDRLAMNKVMEYMAYSLPIVMFDLEECQRIAGGSAVIATGNDPQELAGKIRDMLHDPKDQRLRGRAGRSRLEKSYNWATQKERYLSVYTDLVEVQND